MGFLISLLVHALFRVFDSSCAISAPCVFGCIDFRFGQCCYVLFLSRVVYLARVSLSFGGACTFIGCCISLSSFAFTASSDRVFAWFRLFGFVLLELIWFHPFVRYDVIFIGY